MAQQEVTMKLKLNFLPYFSFI
ncbi:hypothetical protein, partial [Campylobacter coli]